MTNMKTPKVLILIAILALAGATVVAGCGGDNGTTTEEAAPPAAEEEAPAEEEEAPAEEEPAEEKEEAGGESASAAEGKTVFSSSCATCHTLKAAGATGTVGPNLDELEPDSATVEKQVINGGGGMPAFGKEGVLNSKEIKAVSAYVSSAAGQG